MLQKSFLICLNSLYLFAFIYPISIAAANILLGIMVIFLFSKKIYFNKIAILLYTIPALIFISTLLSNSAVDGFLVSSGYKNEYGFVIKHFIWLNLFYLILINCKYDKIKLVRAFLMGVFVSEIVSYLIFFDLIDVDYLKSLKILFKNASPSNPSPFMHHIFYSVFLGVAILLILEFYKELKSPFYFLILISAIVNLFLNGGRTGQIAFLVSLIVYLILKFKRPIISFLIAIFIFFFAYLFSPIFKKRINTAISDIKMIQKGEFNTSLGIRSAIYIVSKDLIDLKTIIFGLGAGDAKKIFLEKSKKYYEILKVVAHTHNQYLQLLFDTGIMGILVIFYIFYLLIKDKNPFNIAIVVFFAFAFLTDVLLYRPKTYLLFLFVLGLAYSNSSSKAFGSKTLIDFSQ